MSKSITFRLPSSLKANRDVHRETIEILGKPRKVSFSYYPKKDAYRVSVNTNEGILLIVRNEKGRWEPMLCEKVQRGVFKTTGVNGESASSAREAFVKFFPKWEEIMEKMRGA